MTKRLKVKEIADRIHTHLKRMEADPIINQHRVYNKDLRGWEDMPVGNTSRGIGVCYLACAWAGGRFVYVRCIRYQSSTVMLKAEALSYLQWLDEGSSGSPIKWGAAKKNAARKTA